jgi:hypothetical protein
MLGMILQLPEFPTKVLVNAVISMGQRNTQLGPTLH